ncbi:uncharacterized protein [Euwallacea fornicatus]|uniref:uncharacterized protein n=1 Tax=Euwallacea fornicatus TaxID=995702 RepID=UPI00338DD3A4
MQVPIFVFTLLSVTCSALAKPYQYSYYISLPGQYQTLEVNDGAAVVNGIQPYPARPALTNPDLLRQGRNRLGFNPELNRRYEPNFVRGRDEPVRGREDPYFRRGGDPFFRDQELYFDQGRQYPQNSRPFNYDPYNQGIGSSRRFPQENFNQVDPYFNGGRGFSPDRGNFSPYGKLVDKSSSEFGEKIEPTKKTTLAEVDSTREEVTTQEPCSFCGVDRVSPKDGIDEVDPDSESVEPKNVVVPPPFAIANNAVTPPGYIPYYVVL